MADEASFRQCGMPVVHPWLCDAMGHLTTRHYLGMFDDASYHLFAALGYEPGSAITEGWGWADVRHEIDYKSELTAGTVVSIIGRVTSLGRTSLSSEFRLLDRSDGRLCAVLAARTVCFDLHKRCSRPLPEAVIVASEELFGAVRQQASTSK
jgi:acyl-CoA thioester hydrolase